jgi:hypothetical protein
MADRNALVLPVVDWVDPDEWAAATPLRRDRYLRAVAELAKDAKRDQVRRGIGSDGRRLAKVKPSSRPDHADGPPLSPHRARSRSLRWLRSAVGKVAGTATLFWSHGWGRILGYHARGEVLGAYIRDVIDFDPASERRLRSRARTLWKTLNRRRPTPPPAPPAAPAQPAIRPRPRLPMRPGIAARPRP